jgi:hypothetical protein
MSEGKMGRRGLLLALVACLSLSAFAGVARADVATVGLPFGIEEPPGITECPENAGCSLMTRAAEAPASATVAAKDGTVVSYSISWPHPAPGYYLSVVRDNGNGTFTATASSAKVTPVREEGVETFGVDMPIKAGEFVALTIPPGGNIGQFPGHLLGVGFGPAGLLAGTTVAPEYEGEGPVAIGYNATIAYQPTVIETITKEVVHTVEVPAKAAPAEAHCVVPKLVGKTPAAAKARLRAADCKVGLVSRKGGVKAAKAKVLVASPKAGATLPAGTAISLKLG